MAALWLRRVGRLTEDLPDRMGVSGLTRFQGPARVAGFSASGVKATRSLAGREIGGLILRTSLRPSRTRGLPLRPQQPPARLIDSRPRTSANKGQI